MSIDDGVNAFGSNREEPGFVSKHVWEWSPVAPARPAEAVEPTDERKAA